MDHYVVEVETTTSAVTDAWVDRVMDVLGHHHAIVTTTAGHGTVLLTVPATDLTQAAITGLALVATVATPLSVNVVPERVRDTRQGWAPVPPLLSVTQAATRAGCSRQAMLGRVQAGSVPGTQVGTHWVIPESAVPTAG